MQESWLGIALMVGVVVVGFIVGILLSKNSNQKRATAFAFISLAFVLILFLTMVIYYSMDWTLPIFIVALVLVPVGVYAGVYALGAREATSVTRRSRSSEVAQAKPKAVEPERKIVSPALVNPETSGDIAENILDTNEASSADLIEDVSNSDETFDADEIFDVAETFDTDETFDTAEALDTDETLDAAEGEVAFVASEFDESLDDEVVEEELGGEEPVEEEMSEEEPVEAASTIRKEGSFDGYFAKADTFKQKGLHAVAARLYAECAQITTDKEKAHRALFESMSSYVKADLAEEAKKIASILQEDVGNLNPIESLKIEAVLRMA